jgi:hypothetical protein
MLLGEVGKLREERRALQQLVMILINSHLAQKLLVKWVSCYA